MATTRYGLPTIDSSMSADVPRDMNALANAIDTALNGTQTIKDAGGTGTAITISMSGYPAYADNSLITFIAAANNAVTATTINVNNLGTKPLYKPGTTAAPNLIAGKAYTVWYDATANAFFIEASAEGTAVAGNVLAGTTFSNDVDTGLAGTMPNRAGDTAALTSSIVGTTLKLRASNGYRDGVDDNVTLDDPDFIAANFRADKNVFGLQGSIPVNTFAAKGNYINALSVKIDNLGNICFEPPTGYYEQGVNGTGYGSLIANDPDFIAANIKNNVNIFGLVGSYDPKQAVFLSAPTLRATLSTSYVSLKRITVNVTATLRTTFQLREGGQGIYTVYAQIYKNGSSAGTVRTTNNNTTSGVTFTEDIAFTAGDIVELMVRTESSSVDAAVQNFKIEDVPVSPTGGAVNVD